MGPTSSDGGHTDGVLDKLEETKADIYIYQVRPVVPTERRPDIQVTVKVISNNDQWNQHCFKIPVRTETTVDEARRRLGKKPKTVLGTPDYAFLAHGKHIPKEKEKDLKVIDILPKLLKDLPQKGDKSSFLFRGNDGQSVEYKKVPLDIHGKRAVVLCAGILHILPSCLQLHQVEATGFSFIPLDATSHLDELYDVKKVELFASATADRINDLSNIIGELNRRGQEIASITDHRGATPLHYAAQRGLLEICDTLLSHGPELIHVQDNNDRLSLHYALYRRQFEVAIYLIQKGSDVLLEDHHGVTCLSLLKVIPERVLLDFTESDETDFADLDPALTYACLEAGVRNNDLAIVTKTLPHCEDCDQQNQLGLTLLHEAALFADSEVVRCLVEKFSLSVFDHSGYLPLHYACQRGHSEMIPLLINAEVENGQINFAILCALYRQRYAAVSVLLEKEGLSLEYETVEVLITAIESNWQGSKSVLHNCHHPYVCTHFLSHAAWEGDEALTQSLLNNGADINFQDLMGRSALHEAAQQGHMNVVEVLLAAPETSLNLRDWRGSTPLHYACANDKADVVHKLVLQDSINVQLTDVTGRTPFLLALYSKAKEAVKTLIHHAIGKINPRKMDKSRRSFLNFLHLLESDDYILLKNVGEESSVHIQDPFPEEKTEAYAPFKISENLKLISQDFYGKRLFNHWSNSTYMLCQAHGCYDKLCKYSPDYYESKCHSVPFTLTKTPIMKGGLCTNCNLFKDLWDEERTGLCECGNEFVDVWFDLDVLLRAYLDQKTSLVVKSQSQLQKTAYAFHGEKIPLSVSPLHEAVLNKSATAYKCLEHELEGIVFRDNFGRTPLLLAIDVLSVEMVQCILSTSQNTTREPHLLHRALNLETWTEEDRASQYQIVSCLLDHGCDPFEPNNDFSFSASLFVSIRNWVGLKFCKESLSNVATAFHVACVLGLDKIIKLFLVGRYAPPEAMALCMAAQCGHEKSVNVLSDCFIAMCKEHREDVQLKLCRAQSSLLALFAGLLIPSIESPAKSKLRGYPSCHSVRKIMEIYEAAGSEFDISPLQLVLKSPSMTEEIESTALRIIESPSYIGGGILHSLCHDVLTALETHHWRVAIAILEKHGPHRLWFCSKHCEPNFTGSFSIHNKSEQKAECASYVLAKTNQHEGRENMYTYADEPLDSVEHLALYGDWKNPLMTDILCLASHPLAPEELPQKLIYGTYFKLNKTHIVRHVQMAAKDIYYQYHQYWPAHTEAFMKLIKICPVIIDTVVPFPSEYQWFNTRFLSPDQSQFLQKAISIRETCGLFGCDVAGAAIATGDREVIQNALLGTDHCCPRFPTNIQGKTALEIACYAGDLLTVKHIMSTCSQIPHVLLSQAALLAFGTYSNVLEPFDIVLKDQWPWTALDRTLWNCKNIFQRLQSNPTANAKNRLSIIELLCDRLDVTGALQSPRCVRDLMVGACLNGLTDAITVILSRAVSGDCSWIWCAISASVVSDHQECAIAVLEYTKHKALTVPVDEIGLTAILNIAANLKQWKLIHYLCFEQTSVSMVMTNPNDTIALISLKLLAINSSWGKMKEEKRGLMFKPILHLACEAGQYKIVHCLLQKMDQDAVGWIVNVRDKSKRTPIDYALCNHHSKIAILLLIYDAQLPNRAYVGLKEALRCFPERNASDIVPVAGYLSTTPQKRRLTKKAVMKDCQIRQIWDGFGNLYAEDFRRILNEKRQNKSTWKNDTDTINSSLSGTTKTKIHSHGFPDFQYYHSTGVLPHLSSIKALKWDNPDDVPHTPKRVQRKIWKNKGELSASTELKVNPLPVRQRTEHEGREMTAYFTPLANVDPSETLTSTYQSCFKCVVKDDHTMSCQQQDQCKVDQRDIMLSLYEIDYGRYMEPRKTNRQSNSSNCNDCMVSTYQTIYGITDNKKANSSTKFSKPVNTDKGPIEPVVSAMNETTKHESQSARKTNAERNHMTKEAAYTKEQFRPKLKGDSTRAACEMVSSCIDDQTESKTLRNAFRYVKDPKRWESLLHAACAYGDSELVDKILRERPSIVNKMDKKNRSPLFYAAFNGHKGIMKILIANNAILNEGCNVLLAVLMHLCKKRCLREGGIHLMLKCQDSCEKDPHLSGLRDIRRKAFESIIQYSDSHHDVRALNLDVEHEYSSEEALEMVEMLACEQKLTNPFDERMYFTAALLGEESICNAIIKRQPSEQHSTNTNNDESDKNNSDSFTTDVKSGGEAKMTSTSFVDLLIAIYLIKGKHFQWNQLTLQKQTKLMTHLIEKFHYLPSPFALARLVLQGFWPVVLTTLQKIDVSGGIASDLENTLYMVMFKASERNQTDSLKVVLEHLRHSKSDKSYLITTLKLAVQNNSQESCTLLLREGADPTARPVFSDSALKLKFRKLGWSALHTLCSVGDLEMLNTFAAEMGGDLESMLRTVAQEHELKKELLFLCAAYGRETIITTFKANGWDIDVTTSTKKLSAISTRIKGNSLLETAAENGHESLCVYLLRNCNVLLQQNALSNVLRSACARGMDKLTDAVVLYYSQDPSRSATLKTALLSSDTLAAKDYPSQPVVYAHSMGHYGVVEKLQLWLVKSGEKPIIVPTPFDSKRPVGYLRNHIVENEEKHKLRSPSETNIQEALELTAAELFIGYLKGQKYTDSWKSWFTDSIKLTFPKFLMIFRYLPSAASMKFVEMASQEEFQANPNFWEDVLAATIRYNRRETFEAILNHALFRKKEQTIISSATVLQEACLAEDAYYLTKLLARGSTEYLTKNDKNGISPIGYASAMGKQQILAAMSDGLYVDEHSDHGVDEDGIAESYSPFCALCLLHEHRGWRSGSFFPLVNTSTDTNMKEVHESVSQPVCFKYPVQFSEFMTIQYDLKCYLERLTDSRTAAEQIYPMSSPANVNICRYFLGDYKRYEMSTTDDRNHALTQCIKYGDENSFKTILMAMKRNDIAFKLLLNEIAVCGRKRLLEYLITTFDTSGLVQHFGSPNPLELAIAFGNTELAFYIVETFSSLPCDYIRPILDYCDGIPTEDDSEDHSLAKNLTKDSFLMARWILGQNRPGDESWHRSLMDQKSTLSHPDVWLAAQFKEEHLKILEAARAFQSYTLQTTLTPYDVTVDYRGLGAVIQLDSFISKVRAQSLLVLQSAKDAIEERDDGKLHYTAPDGSKERLKKMILIASSGQNGKHSLKVKSRGELEITVAVIENNGSIIESQGFLQDDIMIAKKEVDEEHLPFLKSKIQDIFGLNVQVEMSWGSFDVIKDRSQRLEVIRKFADSETSSTCSFGGFMATLNQCEYWIESIRDIADSHMCESLKKSLPAIKTITFRYSTDVRDDIPFKDIKTLLDQKSVAWLFKFTHEAKKSEYNRGVATESTSCNRGAFAPYVYCRLFQKAFIELYLLVQAFHIRKEPTLMEEQEDSKGDKTDDNPLQFRIEWLSASHLGKPQEVLKFIHRPLKQALMTSVDSFVLQKHIEARFDYLHIQFSPQKDQKKIVRGGTSIKFILGVSKDCTTHIELPDFDSEFLDIQKQELKTAETTKYLKQNFADALQKVSDAIKMEYSLPSLTMNPDFKALIDEAASWSNEYSSHTIETYLFNSCCSKRVKKAFSDRLSRAIARLCSMYKAVEGKSKMRLAFLRRLHNQSVIHDSDRDLVIRSGSQMRIIQRPDLDQQKITNVKNNWEILSIADVLRDYSGKGSCCDEIELVLYDSVCYRIAGSAGALALLKMLPSRITVSNNRKKEQSNDPTTLAIESSSNSLPLVVHVPSDDRSVLIHPRVLAIERKRRGSSIFISVDSDLFMHRKEGSNLDVVLDFIDYLMHARHVHNVPLTRQKLMPTEYPKCCSTGKDRKPIPNIVRDNLVQLIKVVKKVNPTKNQEENAIRIDTDEDTMVFFLFDADISWEDVQVAYLKYLIRREAVKFAGDLSAAMEAKIDANTFEFKCENGLSPLKELGALYKNTSTIFEPFHTALCFLMQHCKKYSGKVQGVKSLCFIATNEHNKDGRTVRPAGQILQYCLPFSKAAENTHLFFGAGELGKILIQNCFDSPKALEYMASVPMPTETAVSPETMVYAYFGLAMAETSFVIQGRNVLGKEIKDTQDKQTNGLHVDVLSEDQSPLSGVNVAVENIAACEWRVTWKPTDKGRYHIHAKLFGQHVRGSPFEVHVLSEPSKMPFSLTKNKHEADIGINRQSQLPVVIVHPKPHVSKVSTLTQIKKFRSSPCDVYGLSSNASTYLLRQLISQEKHWFYRNSKKTKMCMLHCSTDVQVEESRLEGTQEVALLNLNTPNNNSVLTLEPHCRHCGQAVDVISAGVVKRAGAPLSVLVTDGNESLTRKNSMGSEEDEI
ncbi:uncharacterized protein LOC106176565 [Lingula anatina]|uniref:Uncharacterized protein LOC106176565 n=1 Tax=Lingula anatina TaxID=7574 RepID=A0A1S3JVN8_LINAN|nr:uncharacterized protein LOC106176565 [Lingula anatina]|eukprot:XP_013414475.1 uncharacterized protein LOC106176565 [Lingula anatina]